MELPPPPRLTPDIALFLDLDGTLTPIKPMPVWEVLEPTLKTIIEQRLAAQNGAMAFVSGRAMAGIKALLSPIAAPFSAMHGIELMDAKGHFSRAPGLPNIAPIRDFLTPIAKRHDLLLEDKDWAMALHYRQHPQLEAKVQEWSHQAVALVDGMTCLSGDMVIEIKPAGISKGSAVQEIMDMPEFRGKVPVFAGDDTTDEDGFQVVRDLGGFGVIVGPRRPTLAQYALDDVGAVYDWLKV